jgi:hypothetical protein
LVAPIVASDEAGPRPRRAVKAEPQLIQNAAFADEPDAAADQPIEAQRIEARPLPLDSADEPAAAPQGDDDALPPVVPASAMKRRPAKRSSVASSDIAPPKPARRLPARPSWMEDIRQALVPRGPKSAAR